MSVRIHLHTLGDARITIGAKDVRPTSPMVFAALLYLCLERGRRVPRTALQGLLFPETGERSGAHSVRQLLYKLRQLGVPLISDQSALELPAEHVSDDLPVLDTITADPALLARCAAGLLPGYHPGISEEHDAWLESQRTRVASRTRAAMLEAMAGRRAVGDHLAMDAIAAAILALDPLNEEATLVRAEVLALSGQKHDAVRVLERYSAEVGATSPDLRIPAEVLRRRIAERFHVSERAAVPMLGRQEELAFLLAQFGRAQTGQGTVSVVWGDAGIGKTRLLQEFSAQLVLKNARVESAHCQPFDRERPLGALVDLVPKLLQARGALGVSPDSMQQLRRLSGDLPADQPREVNPELTAARIREAIADLLSCVSSERPLVLLVEDAHWLDNASLLLLLGLIPGQSSRLHLVITMRDRPRFPAGARLSESVVVRQLTPLSEPVAGDLLTRSLGADYPLDAGVRAQCLSLAAGNPLFICTVAEHLRLRGAAPSAQAGITDLLKQRIRILDAPTLLLLRTIAALGNHATPERLRACTGMSLEVELLSLQELADRGLIARPNGTIKCTHDLLTEVVLGDAPEALRVPLYERVATVLEEDGTAGKQVQLLWSCAESWRLADQNARAAQVLSLCADLAMDLGQPRAAAEALTRAREIGTDSELVELFEKSLRIGDDALDAAWVLSTAEEYRHFRARVGLHPPSTPGTLIAETNARRRQGDWGWSQALTLAALARDSAVPFTSRMKAATTFLTLAEQHFAVDEAKALYDTIRTDQLRRDDSFEWLYLSMTFETMFGDVGQGERIARCLLAILNRSSEVARNNIGANIAAVLYRAGLVDEALLTLHRAIQAGERHDLTAPLINDVNRLAVMYFNIGAIDEASKWNDYAGRLLRRHGAQHNPAFLAMTIDLALDKADVQSAKAHLSLLRTEYPQAQTPYNVRFVIAYDLLISNAENKLCDRQPDLVALYELHERGRLVCDHDFFCTAYAVALWISGRRDESVECLRDYFTSRREKHDLCPLLRRELSRVGVEDRMLATS